MTRKKKDRKLNLVVLDRPPTKQERLADPTSKEARRHKSRQLKKKHLPVEMKTRATISAQERDERAGRKGTRHGGPLAAKIRALNAVADKSEDSSEESSPKSGDE